MTGPLNLDALVDDGEPFQFTFGGEEFTLPPDPPVKAWEYLANGAIQQCLWELLGPEQYERLDAIPREVGVLNGKRAGALITGYQAHLGMAEGKSSGPSKSARLAKSARQVR